MRTRKKARTNEYHRPRGIREINLAQNGGVLLWDRRFHDWPTEAAGPMVRTGAGYLVRLAAYLPSMRRVLASVRTWRYVSRTSTVVVLLEKHKPLRIAQGRVRLGDTGLEPVTLRV